ncbi:hypothetical protein QLH48_05085 [Bacillus safensis]|uniref:hypothetical protein n=1 Tax=Bacillus TaxID=1386 RepID=UPI000F7B89C6|nr:MULTISPECIES: hypothetical protein [Bacillus]MCM3365318.1 hypothetical protein [Bacillus safensis]MDJ0289816.1 hypothetical protein [Bacillus safensis]NMW01655.1 hypothetical protein [Bacillus safensis]
MSVSSLIQNIINDTIHEIDLLKVQNKYTTETAENVVKRAIEKINNINEKTAYHEHLRIRVRNPFRGPISIPNIPVPDILPPIPDILNVPSPEEIARSLEEALKRATKNKLTEGAQAAINNLKNSVPNPVEIAGEMIAEIESYSNQLETLLEQLNPMTLINKAIDDAEKIIKNYLDSHLNFEIVKLKGLSDINITLDGTKITVASGVCLVFNEAANCNQYLKKFNFIVECDITNILSYKISPDPLELSDGNIDIEEKIKEDINKNKNALGLELSRKILECYFPPLGVIKSFMDLLKL